MSSRIVIFILAALALSAAGAELKFDFALSPVDQTPAGFVSLVTGSGAPADWRIVERAVAPVLAPLSSNAEPRSKESVLAVKSLDPAVDHFAVLLYTNDTFQDFTLTTRMKIMNGWDDPAAGLVFRAQNANNYYVLRAGLQGYLLWHRVVDGKSIESLGIGVRTPIARGEWMELKVECQGTAIRGFLNGKLLIPPGKSGASTEDLAVNDSSFANGEIGFWSKGDTAAEFADTRVVYTPRVLYMQTVATEVMKKFPRILGLDIYAERHSTVPVIIGSKDTNNLGHVGGKVETDVIQRGTLYYARDKGWVEVTLPLRDRNGDVAAAMKTRLDHFPGETQDTAVARAVQIKKVIEERMETIQDIME